MGQDERGGDWTSIFEGVLDAFILIRFQPKFEHSSIKAWGGHLKRHQGHQPQSGTSKSSSTQAWTLKMTSIFEGVLDAFKLTIFQSNFNHSSIRACGDCLKCHQGHQPHLGSSLPSTPPQSYKCHQSLIIINSSKNSRNVINLWGSFWCSYTQQISTKFLT